MSQRTLTKRVALVKPGMLISGVDLADERNVAVVMTDEAQQLKRFSFPHTRGGYDYFYQQLKEIKERRESPGVLVGMEPTNYYWRLLAADLEARHPEYAYRLVNPYTVKKHREGDQLARAKDDQRDAFCIADLLRTGKFTETQLQHDGYAQLRQNAVLDNQLRRTYDRTNNQLLNAVGQVFPEIGQVFKDRNGQTAVAMLRHHAVAAHIREMDCAQFIRAVRRDYQGRRMRVSKLQEAHRLAQNSIGLLDDRGAYQMRIRMHLDTLCHLQAQRIAAAEALVDTLMSLPETPYLLSIPHIGVHSAALLLAEIGDPCHFTNSAQLVKLAGTQPVPDLSGRKSRSRTPMSHKGRACLRTTVYWITMRLIQYDGFFQSEYYHLQTRPAHPLTKMEAIGALMNKVLRIAWSLMRNKSYYIPHSCYSA